MHIDRYGLVKGIILELYYGVAYYHDMGVTYRYLKPNNCLLYINKVGDIKIKIANFGLEKMVKDKKNCVMERNGNEYASLWYKDLELLMQQKTYNFFAIAIWALRCIFAKMVIREPVFCGKCPEE